MRLSFVADRYAYLAGIGVMAVLVGGAAQCAVRLPDLARIGASGVLVAVLAVFGTLTWQQTGIYLDKVTFYTHIVSLNPGSEFARRNLASALHDAGRLAEALDTSRIVLDLFPESVNGHNVHGAALLALNRLDEAAESFGRALELDPDHKYARHNLAETRRLQGRYVEALRAYRRALDIDPEFAPCACRHGFGVVSSGAVRTGGAIAAASGFPATRTG